jgi:XPG I-region/XPG N-terminal domain
MLTNEDGETTSHLMGMFYRTLRIVDNGIKPVYVFDGAPPKLKSGELAKRFQRKATATEGLEEAKETGTAEEVEKFSRRTVRVTREHNAECQRLLKLMGIPYIIAPTEAEAQCAVLARAGKVYAAASEDMDTLCFDSPVLLRHLTFSEQRKEPIQEIFLEKVLAGLNMERKQVPPSPPLLCYISLIWFLKVRRPLYPPRLRLPRPHPQNRSLHRPKAYPRIRLPRKVRRSSPIRQRKEIRHSRRLAIRRRTRTLLQPRCPSRHRPGMRIQMGSS